MKKLVITIAVILAVYLVATFVCYLELGTVNVISSAIGIVKLEYLDVQYVQVQKNPKAIFAKSPFNLDEYMKKEGFEKKDQLGGMCSYTNGDVIQYVEISSNRYFNEIIWSKDGKESDLIKENSFRGTVVEIEKNIIVVQPDAIENIASENEIKIQIQEDINEFQVGSNLEIKYKGEISKNKDSLLNVVSIQLVPVDKYAEMYKCVLDDIIMDDDSVLKREDELIILDLNSFGIDEKAQNEINRYMYKFQFKVINGSWDEVKENKELITEDGVIPNGVLINSNSVKISDDEFNIELTEYKSPIESYTKKYKVKYDNDVWDYEIM